jgi:hypothetical protein
MTEYQGFQGQAAQQPTAPWAPGASPPQPQQPPQQPVTQSLADTVASLDKDPGMPRRPTPVYQLPMSAVDSVHWRGSEGDRSFALSEPNADDIKSMIREEVDWSEAPPRFITHTGSDVVGSDGLAVMQPCGYREAQAWWLRLNPKARTLVVALFMGPVVPTEEEGELLRGSRRMIA